MDEVRTLPLTPQRVAQKANLSFKNKFLYISATDEAIDFKFGTQLRFAKAHHQIQINLNRISSATKFLCAKTFSGNVVVGPFSDLMVYRCWQYA